MQVSAENIFEAVASKIENQCRLPAEHLKSVKSRALAIGALSKHFSLLEVECLIRQFYVLLGQESKLARPIPGMDKLEFVFVLHAIFGMDNKMMIDRIFAILDQNKDGFIGVEEWVESLGVFLRGDLDEKSNHAYQVYDLNSDKCISKDEMFFLLKKGETIKSKSDEDLEDVLNMTFKDIDHDHDGLLTYTHFQKLVRKDMMYLEAFGKCLPDPFAVTAFERHLAELNCKSIYTRASVITQFCLFLLS
uniref:EF-hand domain-containing protein n=1 Tax=Neogobius melanostomus TaxID=47308 RepID=A0A8C6T5R8_9GOBI